MTGFDPELADTLGRKADFDVTVEQLHSRHKLIIEGPRVPEVVLAHANNQKALLNTVESDDSVRVEVIYPDPDAHPLPDNVSELPDNNTDFDY